MWRNSAEISYYASCKRSMSDPKSSVLLSLKESQPSNRQAAHCSIKARTCQAKPNCKKLTHVQGAFPHRERCMEGSISFVRINHGHPDLHMISQVSDRGWFPDRTHQQLNASIQSKFQCALLGPICTKSKCIPRYRSGGMPFSCNAS